MKTTFKKIRSQILVKNRAIPLFGPDMFMLRPPYRRQVFSANSTSVFYSTGIYLCRISAFNRKYQNSCRMFDQDTLHVIEADFQTLNGLKIDLIHRLVLWQDFS